jgi:hypothetical protein
MATIHGLAKRNGEYHRKPITIVATADPNTAQQLTHMRSIVPSCSVVRTQAETDKGRMP